MARTQKAPRLVIKNFAQIGEVNIEFGDLTVLVGPQGTGKSLALQWLKTAVDGKALVERLRDAGQAPKDRKALLDLIFGMGMNSAWKPSAERTPSATDEGRSKALEVAEDSEEVDDGSDAAISGTQAPLPGFVEPDLLPPTTVEFDGKQIIPEKLLRKPKESPDEMLFYIPAHRSMLISDGWASPFQKLPPDYPVVARAFSQTLFDRFNERTNTTLFPLDRKLKSELREQIDGAIYHGGTIGIERGDYAQRLKLTHGESQLPFMTWTAGQREFTPLLLGLYHLLPSTKVRKVSGIDWVVIEEPEMGLHPKAISVVLLLVLDLLWRGYRVVLSTHSPHILSAVWMLRLLKQFGSPAAFVAEAFGVSANRQFANVTKEALSKTYRVYCLDFDSDRASQTFGKVISKDISELDPGAEDESVSGWGGLTGYSSVFSDVVAKAVNESGGQR